MNSVWQQLTLFNLPLYQWRSASYLYSLTCGSLGSWRQSSWLMQWAEPLGFVLLSLVFALAPFVGNALIGLLLVAGGAFWVLMTLSDRQVIVFTPIHLLVLLYWSVVTVATAMSPVKAAAFVGWGKLTLYLVFFALMARVLRSPKLRGWLIALYLHIALIVSFYGIRQWIDKVPPLATWNDPTSTQANLTRAYSYLGNPNLLGAYLLPAIALSFAAIFVWKGWGPKALAVTMLLVNGACLRFTDSRGAWIGCVVLMVVFSILIWYWFSPRMPRFWRTWALPAGLGGFAFVLILGLLLVEPLRNRVTSIFVGRGDSSNNFRINVWTAVIQMIRDRPILGIGPGNVAFNKIYPLYMRPRYSALSAYSVLLEITVESGFIGLMTFLWLLAVTFNQGFVQIKSLRGGEIIEPISRDEVVDRHLPISHLKSIEGFWLMAAIATLAGMMAHGFVDTVWYRPEVNMLWWLMVAIIASYYTVARKPQPELQTGE
ncbi:MULTISPECIES: IctB family putative bicarbonate transporter [Kamptonema]|uniref:IctB family putative bicarbonate transporter n=1 Tax=Kamptonema TaxID=1501433 RepID=UPI0001DAD2C0|nr:MULTISPECIES: IctB family putative bicarbonate transporter [Kamptonema]CBN59410.1 O-antigen polymerase [Kamptonema sp. PCC 6506]